MGFRKKVSGYVVVQWDSDHPPMHVHVYKDRECVAKFNLENQEFMQVNLKHKGRLIKALAKSGLLREKAEFQREKKNEDAKKKELLAAKSKKM